MKITTKTLLICSLLMFFAADTYAQMAVGISYENRSENPTNGFGLHFEKDISPLPLIGLNIRLHGSMYSETYSFTLEGVNIEGENEDKTYEIGLGLLGSVSAGLAVPYAGVGIGYEFFDRESTIIEAASGSDNSFFYYGVVGVGVSAVPFLRPFIEYRYKGVTSDDFMPSDVGTWAFGVQLRF